MKVLLITEFFPESSTAMSGGVEARAYHIVQGLKKGLHEVTVIARKRHYIAATPLSIFPRLWFQIQALVKGLTMKPEVVEGSNFVSYLPAFLIAKIKRVPAIAWYADVYEHTWFTTMSWPVAVGGWLLERLTLKLPWDRIIAMSQATKIKLIKAGVSEASIYVVYGGVDIGNIKSIHVAKFDHPSICTAARLVAYKHIDDLIQAVGLVQQHIPKVHLYIMGEGPEREKLALLSNKCTTKYSVHFLGNVSQEKVWQTMKQSQVFSLPSTVEGFGLVTMEALACGIPYVNADIPPTREITEGGKGGLLYEPRNIQALAQGLERLLTQPALCHQKITEGSRLYPHFDWDLITQATLSVYRRSL